MRGLLWSWLYTISVSSFILQSTQFTKSTNHYHPLWDLLITRLMLIHIATMCFHGSFWQSVVPWSGLKAHNNWNLYLSIKFLPHEWGSILGTLSWGLNQVMVILLNVEVYQVSLLPRGMALMACCKDNLGSLELILMLVKHVGCGCPHWALKRLGGGADLWWCSKDEGVLFWKD